MTKESLVVNRLRSIGYAFRGALLLLRSEPSIQIQMGLAVLMTVLGVVMDISATEWMFQITAIAMVMGVEGLNTAVEKLCDFVHPGHEPKIGLIKDVAAGAVMLVSIGAVLIGAIIYLPKFF
ncbi:diacylglycerol kinase [Maribacter sp. 2307ULW6-5]|uniref:diacylglycerol kinase n=1 Tax=Maribacter sp. 2307ULW6-5 TaxID=3386275 RepID=UPI0039BCE4E6